MKRWGWILVPMLAVVGLVTGPVPVEAQRRAPIDISDPNARSFRVAVQRVRPVGSNAQALAEEVQRNLERGLVFSSLFQVIPENAFLGPVQSPPMSDRSVNCPQWSQIGADVLVRGEVAAIDTGLRAEFRVYDVARGCRLQAHRKYRAPRKDVRRAGKALADRIVGAFTGQPGVADTELAFVSNRTGTKELHVMDADGQNLRTATRNGSINSFPDWAPDGETIVYTSYKTGNRPWLYMLTRGRKSPGRILRNLRARDPLYRGVFGPRGERLALVRSVNGATEIFTVGSDGGNLRRLTKHRAIDVSPAWSPDGTQLAFVSDRSGSPQVYVMNDDGSDLKRITFNGGYNTNPAWSPDGRWIAYEARVGGHFDIWIIDPEGRTNVPLVTHRRSDEHPSWSPDSRKIAFQSTRRGRSDIYLVDLSGDNVRRVTEGGENTNPSWGPHRSR